MDERPNLSPYSGLAAKIRGGKSASQVEYESTPPVLSVLYTRAKTGLFIGKLKFIEEALALPGTPLKIEIDGAVVATIYPTEKAVFELAPGEHRLRVVSWLKWSSVQIFQLANGQRAKYWCQPASFGIILQRDQG